MKSGRILLAKRKVPCGWPACLRRKPPRVAFKNNDIYVVDDEESSNYEEPRERHSKVQYKLRVCKNPTAKNMPHEKEYDDNKYESIDELLYKQPLMIFYVILIL